MIASIRGSIASLGAMLLLAASTAAYVTPESSQALLRPGGADKYPGSCPCANQTLCGLISSPRFADGKELFVFHVAGEPGNFEQWRHYDYSRITAIAIWEFESMGAELFCYAHSLGIRIIIPATPTAKVYSSKNESAKAEWAAGTVAGVKAYFADGINMDTEDAIPPGNITARDGLTSMAKLARDALDTAGMTNAIVTFDVGWMPGVDGRFYDFQGLAEACDYLIIMAYDMASYIWGACLATPNSPPPQVMQGVLNYLALVKPSQLVLALPWYGRKFTCANGTAPEDRFCPIAKPSPWRDCNCTDASADAVDFSSMAGLVPKSSSGPQRDAILQSPWINSVDAKTGAVTQIWYDDVQSLSIKYAMAATYGLRGVGVWTPNMLDYGPPPFNNTAAIPKATKDMWTAISTVPFGIRPVGGDAEGNTLLV